MVKRQVIRKMINKKALTTFALLCFPLWGLEAWAQNTPITYIERSWDNNQKKIVETEKTITDYTILTGSDDWARLGADPADDNDHYYVVTGNVSYKVLNVYGRAHLVLCDGATLTCTGSIMVEKDHHDAKLFIYSQSYGTNQGKLKVNNEEYKGSAGIGSSSAQKCGEITIHGGDLDITGAKWAAGIGGGGFEHTGVVIWDYQLAEDGTTRIYGGTIKAQGGELGAGIGGGGKARGGKLYIYGGDVTATGGEMAAGVGGGGGYHPIYSSTMRGLLGGSGGWVYVYGGKLTAQGGKNAAGIGTAPRANNSLPDIGELYVYGGAVTATGGEYSAGIGGGYYSNGIKTYIYGGTVSAKGGEDGAGIGAGEFGKVHQGNDGKGGETHISGGTVRAEGTSYGSGIGGGEYGFGGNTYITGGTVIAIAGKDCKGREIEGGSAIGCGQGISNKDADKTAFKLEIGSNLMVTAGDTENNNDGVFSSAERNPACRWRNFVRIEPCPHTPQNGDAPAEVITYNIVDASYHERYCRYCQNVTKEQHVTTGECPCGMTGYSFTTYVPVANPEVDGYGYQQKQTYMVKAGNEFYLPECHDVPTGYKFLGWEMNPDPSDAQTYDVWAAKKGGDIGGDDKIAAGTSVKSFEGMDNAKFYARYLYDLKDEWTWNDDNTSCWLKISGDALMYTENVEFKENQIVKQYFDDNNDGSDDRVVYSISYTYTLRGYDYYFSTKKSVPFELTLKDDSDNSAAIEKYVGKTATPSLTGRTLYTNGSWNTLCLPFDMSEDDFGYYWDLGRGKKVKTLASSQYDEATGTLTLNFEDAEEIKAGIPYLISWEFDEDDKESYANYQSSYNTFDADANITYYKFDPAVIDNTLRPTETAYVDFIGSFSPVSLTAGDKTILYLGSNNTLYYPSAEMTIGSCRAHFKLKGLTVGDLVQGANSIVLDFGGETTGVALIDNGKRIMDNDACYTIDGRRLNGKPTQKGIYINNGKRVVIK